MPVLKVVLGDVVRMRKTHPCGNDQWEVVRLGADIGIRCLKCGRRVLMPRVKFERRDWGWVWSVHGARSRV